MKMIQDDICVLDMDLRLIGKRSYSSVESAMHAAIYKTRPDVNAIIHTHQVYPSTLALIGKSIPAPFDEQVRFLGRSVDIIPYAPSGTGMSVNTVVKSIRNHNNAFMMANHGAFLLAWIWNELCITLQSLKNAPWEIYLRSVHNKANRIPLLVREVAFAKLRKDQKNTNMNLLLNALD